jgi:hypothetical protein
LIYKRKIDIMKYVKLFESWTEEKEEEVSHKELYEMLEDLVDAWKEWKENDDEDADEEELHDEFMKKVESLVEKAKEIVEEEEEEEEEGEEGGSDEIDMDSGSGESDEAEVETEDVEEIEESRDDLSKRKGSLSYMLEPLIPLMDKMTLDELKDAFMEILQSPELRASQMTRKKWMPVAMGARSKPQLMQTISNIYLRGAGHGANPDDYK